MKDPLFRGLTVGLLAVLLAATFFFGGRAVPTAARPEHSMTVTGQANLDAVPDQAQIELGLTLRAATAQDAQKQGAAKMDAVIKALKDAGIKAEDIQTRNLSLNPVYDYTQSGQKFLGYDLTNTVNFKTSDFAGMGAVIDKAVAAGANRVNSLQFVLKDKSKYNAQAIDQAIADARAKADAAAKSLGTSVTGVKTVSVQDNNYVPSPIYRMTDSAKSVAGAASMPVEPGQVQFQVNVSVEFVIK